MPTDSKLEPRQSAAQVRGILFDMDGVLADSEEFIAEAARAMFLETYGVTVALEDFLPFVGAGEDRYLGGVASQHRESSPTCPETKLERMFSTEK